MLMAKPARKRIRESAIPQCWQRLVSTSSVGSLKSSGACFVVVIYLLWVALTNEGPSQLAQFARTFLIAKLEATLHLA
eukprot:2693036-Amphidinium_carterae.1